MAFENKINIMQNILLRVLVMLFLIALVVPQTVMGQSSTSYQCEEYTFNSGGNPNNGVVLQSSNFQMTLDSIGDSLAESAIAQSLSYSVDSGFPPAYTPPIEVLNLQFTDKITMIWDLDPSIGHYNVYRGLLSNLGADYGSCLQTGVDDETTQDLDPYANQAYFYIITSANRIYEEGTMGNTSSGTERSNTNPCY